MTISAFVIYLVAIGLAHATPIGLVIFLILGLLLSYVFSLLYLGKTPDSTAKGENMLLLPTEDKRDNKVQDPPAADPTIAQETKQQEPAPLEPPKADPVLLPPPEVPPPPPPVAELPKDQEEKLD